MTENLQGQEICAVIGATNPLRNLFSIGDYQAFRGHGRLDGGSFCGLVLAGRESNFFPEPVGAQAWIVRSVRPAGYGALIARFRLDVIPNWHQSFVAAGNTHKVDTTAGVTEEIYPARYWPGDTLGDQLEFALKYDGTSLAILASVFKAAPLEEVQQYVASTPRGKYTRRLWFLYEMLTGSALPLEDLKTGGYIDLLDPDEYYTVTASRPVRRQRINDNLLGDARFCPTIRRTGTLRAFEKAELPSRCQKIVANYSPQLLKRAMSYLYTKETKSSFEIEHIKPNSTRTERFIALLQLAEKEDFCDKVRLLDLQNRIVDPRFPGHRLPELSELCRRDGRIAEGEGPLCLSEAGRSERTDGGIDHRPQADGRGNCAGRGPRRRRGVWLRFSASVRGR